MMRSTARRENLLGGQKARNPLLNECWSERSKGKGLKRAMDGLKGVGLGDSEQNLHGRTKHAAMEFTEERVVLVKE